MDKINAWWHTGDGNNFGDVICPEIIRSLTDNDVVFSSGNGALLSIGSVLFIEQRYPKIVWGTGALDEKQQSSTIKDYTVHSVRGPKTRKRLIDIGVQCPEKYGDPAILLPILFDMEYKETFEISILPHWLDLPLVKSMKKDALCNVIDIRMPVSHVLEQVKRSKRIITSSLHGVIVGEAYNKETKFVRFDDKLYGGYFKFEDYYNSTERELQVYDNRSSSSLNTESIFSKQTESLSQKVKRKNIIDTIKSFPYKIKNEKVLDYISEGSL